MSQSGDVTKADLGVGVILDSKVEISAEIIEKDQLFLGTGPAEIYLPPENYSYSSYAISPGGQYAVLRGMQPMLYSFEEEKILRTYPGHDFCMGAFIDDKQQLITMDRTMTIRIWDMITGEIKKSFSYQEFDSKSNCAAQDSLIKLNNKTVATAVNDKILIWDIVSGRLISKISPLSIPSPLIIPFVSKIQGIPGTTQIITIGGPLISCVDWQSGIIQWEILTDGYTMADFALSPDSNKIYLIEKKVSDLNQKNLEKFIKLGEPNCRINVIDTNTGESSNYLMENKQYLNSVTVHPDGKHLLVLDNHRDLNVWDLLINRTVTKVNISTPMPIPSALYGISVSQDGTKLDVMFSGIWDLSSGENFLTLDDFRYQGYSITENTISISEGDDVFTFDLRSGNMVRKQKNETRSDEALRVIYKDLGSSRILAYLV